MEFANRSTRWFVAVALAFSLGHAGMNSFLDRTERVYSATITAKPAKCCCGTKNGECCGKGCCAARRVPQKPPSCPCPLQQDSRGGRTILVLAVFHCQLDAFGDCNRHWVARAAALAPPSAWGSLQAQHVRFDA